MPTLPETWARAAVLPGPRARARDEDLARADGRLELAFARAPGGRTRLAQLGQRSPLRALFPG